MEDGKSDTPTTRQQWKWCGIRYPKQEVVFFAQIFILYVVIIASIANLSYGTSQHNNLWITLLSSCVGYLLPNPSVNNNNKHGTLLRDAA